jgi:hypothetical protein
MTPVEKAKKLFDKYFFLTLNVESDDDVNKYTAKICALIAVDEVLENSHTSTFTKYWNEVKHEIKKL